MEITKTIEEMLKGKDGQNTVNYSQKCVSKTMAMFLRGKIMVTLTDIENTEARTATVDSVIISVCTH